MSTSYGKACKLHTDYRQIYIEHSSGSPKFSSIVLNAVVLCAAEIPSPMFSHLLKDTDIANASNRIGYLDVPVDADSIMVMVGRAGEGTLMDR